MKEIRHLNVKNKQCTEKYGYPREDKFDDVPGITPVNRQFLKADRVEQLQRNRPGQDLILDVPGRFGCFQQAEQNPDQGHISECISKGVICDGMLMCKHRAPQIKLHHYQRNPRDKGHDKVSTVCQRVLGSDFKQAGKEYLSVHRCVLPFPISVRFQFEYPEQAQSSESILSIVPAECVSLISTAG